MKFAHFADCHIGSWRDEKLKQLNMQAFKKAIQICIEKQVDFTLISGDLFNTALPDISYIKECVIELKKLKDNNIRCYIIPGSHDFSPSGKTMLDVLEKADLVTNVMQYRDHKLTFTIDPTGAKIVGIYGRRGGLDREDYKMLDKPALEQEPGFKIFMFHTAINEFKPDPNIPGEPVTSLPKNFQYYAGGHIHYIFQKKLEQGYLTFPGALFPNNFKELEEWKHGGLYICDDQLNLEYIPIQLKEVASVNLNFQGCEPEQAEKIIKEELEKINTIDKIVTVRLSGEIDGKPSDINFKKLLNLDAYIVLRNTAKLIQKTNEQTSIKHGTVEEIEKELVQENKQECSEEFIATLMKVLDKEKQEGEKTADFEKRITADASQTLNLEL